MTKRRVFVAGNWKMNGDRGTCQSLLETLTHRLGTVQEVDLAVAPPFPYLFLAHDLLAGTAIALGAQNIHFEKSGAFTGEVSPTMLADCGCKYVIVGHSERRLVLGETDDAVQRKLRAALHYSLQPILCIGETLAQRQAGQTHEVLSSQLRSALVGVPLEQLRQVTIAYEPVWAIGVGGTPATPEQAQEAHAFIRETLTKSHGADLAQTLCLQYGGNVRADNADSLLTQPDVDGALVGGASLKPDDFTEIVRAAIRVAQARRG